MPRKTKNVQLGVRKYGTKSNYTEAILEEALEKIRSGAMTRVQASKHFAIPPTTLFYKLTQKHNKNVGRPTIFGKEEEESFKSHLLLLSDLGIPISMTDFRVIIQQYLNNKNITVKQFKNNLPGYEWGTLFIERHPQLKEKVAHKIPRKRAQVNREQIQDFFNHLQTELKDVEPKNIYNMDESGFHDDPGKKKLLFRRDNRHPEIIKNATKSCYTIIFCGNANGDLLPPYFVFKGKKLWSDWLYQAPPGSRMSVSKSGWIDMSIFEEWLEIHFLPYVAKDEGKKVLLCDNLSAHISPKALRLCAANNVSFVCLIPNSTHLLQPLDVGYFSSVKTAWRQVLSDYRKTARGKKVIALPKSLFAQLIKITLKHNEATSADNLRAGFRSCGIYPFSPNTVMNKLPSYTSPTEQVQTVSETFINFIEEVRQADLCVVKKARKFQLPVTAGKSVSAEEVEKYQEEREKANSKKNQGNKDEDGSQTKKRGRPKGTENKTKKDSKKKRVESAKILQPVNSIEMNTDTQVNKSKTVEEKTSRDTAHLTNTDLQTNIDLEIMIDDEKLPELNIVESIDLPVEGEYVVEYDGTLSKIIHSAQDTLSVGLFCVFKDEGTLFPGQIQKLSPFIMISVLIKQFDGGWAWPSKKDVCKIDRNQIVSVLNDHQIRRNDRKLYITDDILCKEWGE